MYLALIFCLLAPVALAVGDGTLQFINQPRDQIAREGETVTLYCSVNNAAANGRFLWVRDDQVISQGYTITVAQDPHRYSIQGIDGEYTLRIVNAKAEDSGSYRCMVTSGGSGIMSNLGRLVVESPPAQDYPTCKSSETNEVAVGESVTVSCTVAGGNPVAELTLHKNDIGVVAERIIDGVSHTWTVTEADHGAQFSCIGTHPFWTESRSCRVGPFRVVTESPTALLVPRNTATLAGGAASFVCSASYAPRAHYRWYLDESEVFHGAENNRFTIQLIQSSSILQIHGVFESDTGRVLCYVEAATGTIFAEAYLEVNPYIPVDPVLPSDLPITGPAVDIDYTEQPDPAPPKEEEAPESFSVINYPVIIGSVAAGLILILLVAIVVIVVVLARAHQNHHTGKCATPTQIDPVDEDVLYRSRYVSVVRSWLFPVHSSTQTGVAAFGVDNPNMVHNPNNLVQTISK